MERSEIYITSIVYKSQTWLDDPDSLLNQVYDNLNEIKNFYFTSISLDMAQVYNVSLKQTNYDAMMIFLKGVRYGQNEFMTFKEVQIVVDEVTKQLEFIDDLSFGNIEVRSSKLYSDKELGLVTVTHNAVDKPTILESIPGSII